MTERAPSMVEIRVVRQITELREQISRLTIEQKALESFLIKIRQEDRTLRDVSRRNSVNRVLFEEFVLNQIDRGKGPVASNSILRAMIKNTTINPSTFRSSMKRMKDKGLIQAASHGKWVRPA